MEICMKTYTLTMRTFEKIFNRYKMALEFKSCCFTIDLRTGSLIIGCLCLVANMTIIIAILLALILYAIFSIVVNYTDLMPQGIDKETQKSINTCFTILPIVLAIFLMNMIFTSILLIGVQKKKRGHIKSYLTFAPIFILICLAAYVYKIVSNATTDVVTFFLIIILILIYFVLVVRSYYLKMDDPNKSPGIHDVV